MLVFREVMQLDTMTTPAKITAILGTYRKGGVIDSAVEEILVAAREAGAETEKIYLLDKRIEFCTNCRACTQQEGQGPGQCRTDDDMRSILDAVERSDALVLACPTNFGTVTALMKRFIERLLCLAYWPWGALIPKVRRPAGTKRAVAVASSAAPAIMGRWLDPTVGLLKKAARLTGAKKVDVLFIGLAAGQQRTDIGHRARSNARRLGEKLASHRAR